jgi:hypothetical protein
MSNDLRGRLELWWQILATRGPNSDHEREELRGLIG